MQPGRDGRPRLLILAHGAGSGAEFLGRAFPPSECRMTARYLDERSADVSEITRQLLAAACESYDQGVAPVLGGVSVGAHAAAFACLQAPPDLIVGCVLVMPAWNGPCPPDSPTATAAAEVGRYGADSVLRRLAGDPLLAEDWVAHELGKAWRDRPSLPAELATAARSSAPTLAELANLDQPALVVALADDPVHPIRVARAWAQAVPDAELAVIGRRDPSTDLAVFGRTVGDWAGRRLSGPR